MSASPRSDPDPGRADPPTEAGTTASPAAAVPLAEAAMTASPALAVPLAEAAMTASPALAVPLAEAAMIASPALADTSRGPSLAGAAIRTWLRYVVPLTVLSAVALSPLVILALQVHVPKDAAEANAALALGWAVLGIAWLGQLVLVGGAAAMTGPPRSQRRALTAGLLRLLGAIVPCLAAAAAIALASLAFVVPGLALFVLLSLTGASPTRGLPGALRDSIAVARAHLPAVVVIVVGMLVLDAAIGAAAYRMVAPRLAKPPTPAQLAAARSFVRAVVVALVALSPLPATLLATLRRRAEPASASTVDRRPRG